MDRGIGKYHTFVTIPNCFLQFFNSSINVLEEASTFVSMSNPVSLQECIDTDDEGPREDNAAYLHRGSCLFNVINVTIDSKSRP